MTYNNIFTQYRIQKDGDTFNVEWSTNDNNDDGYPDGEIVSSNYTFPALDQAIRFTGYTRRGFYNQPVNVYLEGDLLYEPRISN